MVDLLVLLPDLVLHGLDLLVPGLHVIDVLLPEFAQSFDIFGLRLAAEHLEDLCLELVELGVAVLLVVHALGNAVLEVVELAVEVIVVLL